MVSASSPRKRRRTDDDTSKQAEQRSETQAASNKPTMLAPASAAPAARPLSAVAARKAAAAAATSATTLAAPSTGASSSATQLAAHKSNTAPSDDIIGSAELNAILDDSSASSQDEGEDGVGERQARRKRKLGAKGKTRYYQGDESAVNSSVDTEGERESRAAAASSAKRPRRREKNAFFDSSCVSSFVPQSDGSNVRQLTGASSTRATLFLLKPGESLVIHGVCSIAPVFGTLSINGALLSASDRAGAGKLYRLFSPSSHPVSPIVAILTAASSTKKLMLPDDYEDLSVSLEGFAAAVLVEELACGIEGIDSVLTAAGVGSSTSLWPERLSRAERHTSSWQLITSPQPSLAGLQLPSSWSTVLESVTTSRSEDQQQQEPEVILLEGAKRSGKSTLAKMLLNRLLSRHERVAYLDTDLGQPESTPPGLISLTVHDSPLLGPAFTHLQPGTWQAAHFLGDTSPADDPAAYLAAVDSLVQTYADEVAQNGTPLIVNTHGWVKGLGADLLLRIKELVRPTRTLSFAGADEEQWHAADMPLVLETAPPSPLEARWTAADLRTLNLASYFYSHENASTRETYWDFSSALVSRRPFVLPWSDTSKLRRVYLRGADGVQPHHVLHVLNGSIVAFVASTSEETADAGGSLSYEDGEAAPVAIRCLGLGVVRGVDMQAGALHLLTPLSAQTLGNASPVALVRGTSGLELPVALAIDHTATSEERALGVAETPWREVPYLSTDGEGSLASGRRRIRRNVMRRAHT